MSNLFDNTKVAYQAPRQFVRGDYVAWRNSSYVLDYPPASYDLAYNFRKEGASAGELVVQAVEDNDEFLFEISSTESGVVEAGAWFYDVHIIRKSDSARITLASGVVQVLANKAEDPDDPRALPRIMVAKYEQLWLDRLNNRQVDVTSFDNGETSVSRDTNLIRQQLEYWRRREQAAIRKDRQRRGLPHSGIIRSRV